jgi:predicted transcriptional regulator
MKTSITNLTNQTVRSSKIKTNELGEYKWEYGYTKPESFEKVGSSILLYIYMFSVAKEENNEWLFCVPTKVISENISISPQQVQRSLQKLVENNLIEDTGRRIEKSKVFKMVGEYNPVNDHAIPAIIAVTKTIPLSLKLFILKAQFMMNPSRREEIVFKHDRELRIITNNYRTLTKNLNMLEERGLIERTEEGKVINLKNVYHTLHREYISSKLKTHNLI